MAWPSPYDPVVARLAEGWEICHVCVRCGKVPRIDFRSVPIKFLEKARREKEVIEAIDGPVIQTIWYKTKESYIVSMDYEYGEGSVETLNFNFFLHRLEV